MTSDARDDGIPSSGKNEMAESLLEFSLFTDEFRRMWTVIDSEDLEDAVDDIAEKFIDYPITAIMLGAGLFRENYTLRAYDLMELSAEAHPEPNGRRHSVPAR